MVRHHLLACSISIRIFVLLDSAIPSDVLRMFESLLSGNAWYLIAVDYVDGFLFVDFFVATDDSQKVHIATGAAGTRLWYRPFSTPNVSSQAKIVQVSISS